MATTTIQPGSSIASFGDSYMPSFSDPADIQTALKALYFGSTGSPNTSNGIYGALHRLYVGNPTLAGNVTITGNLIVNGDTTTINTSTLDVEDIEVTLGKVASPTDATAANGGIRLRGTTDKTITWVPGTLAWTSNQDFNLDSGKVYEINGTTVLSATQVLGKSLTNMVETTATQTLTNKTLTSPTINSPTIATPTITGDLTGNGRLTATSPGSGTSGAVVMKAISGDATPVYLQFTNNATTTQWGAIGATSTGMTYQAGSAGTSPHVFSGAVTTDTISTSLTTTGTAALWNTGLTTGTISIGGALTTGTVNIASGTAGAKTINIGTSTGTVAINGATTFSNSINTPGIARTGSSSISISTADTTGSSGSISITTGNSTVSGAPGSVNISAGSTASATGGDVIINAGGGTTNGTVYLQSAMGNNGGISLGSTSSTTAVNGNLTVGGGFGSTGVSITTAGNIQADGSLDVGGGFGSTGVTITTAGNIQADGSLEVGGGFGFSGATISNAGALSLDASINAGSHILSVGRTSSVTEQVGGFYLNSNGSLSATRDNGTPLYSHRYGSITGNQDMIQFVYKGNLSGTITTTSGGTPQFAGTSDYRMKTDITPITDAIERMKKAKVYTFYKNIDPSHTLQTGFIAHELAEVQPDVVIGEKDAVDNDGNPIYQQVMETKLIPVMAQAINDLIGMVEKLALEVEKLKTK